MKIVSIKMEPHHVFEPFSYYFRVLVYQMVFTMFAFKNVMPNTYFLVNTFRGVNGQVSPKEK